MCLGRGRIGNVGRRRSDPDPDSSGMSIARIGDEWLGDEFHIRHRVALSRPPREADRRVVPLVHVDLENSNEQTTENLNTKQRQK